MATIIRDEKLTRVSGNVKPDSRRRVVLPETVLAGKDIVYHVYTNSYGQIILDPQVTIPASEAWIFEDKAVLAALDEGMAESNNGQLINRGSFAKYAADKS
jgi:CRISPR/Cas system-associated protein Csm6